MASTRTASTHGDGVVATILGVSVDTQLTAVVNNELRASVIIGMGVLSVAAGDVVVMGVKPWRGPGARAWPVKWCGGTAIRAQPKYLAAQMTVSTATTNRAATKRRLRRRMPGVI